MDPVHGGGPWTRSKEGVHVLSSPFNTHANISASSLAESKQNGGHCRGVWREQKHQLMQS